MKPKSFHCKREKQACICEGNIKLVIGYNYEVKISTIIVLSTSENQVDDKRTFIRVYVVCKRIIAKTASWVFVLLMPTGFFVLGLLILTGLNSTVFVTFELKVSEGSPLDGSLRK